MYAHVDVTCADPSPSIGTLERLDFRCINRVLRPQFSLMHSVLWGVCRCSHVIRNDIRIRAAVCLTRSYGSRSRSTRLGAVLQPQ